MTKMNRKVGKRVLAFAAGMAIAGAATLGIWWGPSSRAQQSGVSVAGSQEILAVGKGVPAKNPVTLSLIVDGKKVVGWISGTRDFSGKQVKIATDKKTESVLVQDSNTFTYYYKVDQKEAATFSIDNMKQVATLEPQSAPEPTAFFVVDRSVYRPGQDIKFAGFLRSVDENGDFVPVVGKEVDVQIISQRKKTTAAQMKLTSDDMGRIEGTYHWSEGDVMDDYTVSIAGYKGSASVALAEYRKSKIKLKIAGKVDGDKLKIQFDAVDFLEKAVPGSKVSFVAQVTRNEGEKKKNWTLNGDEFVYQNSQPSVLQPEDMSEEETLLAESDETFMPMYGWRGKTVVTQVNQELGLDKGSGVYTLDLRKEWLAGPFSVEVQGVLIDANGREQRSSETITLNQTKQPKMNITLPKRMYAAGETITVNGGAVDEKGAAVAGSSTLVAMKLTTGQVVYADANAYYNYYGYYGYRTLASRRNPVITQQEYSRTLVTAVPMVNGQAKVQLNDAGAYKLVVVTQAGEGKTITDEVGCVVRDPNELPGLLLTTNKSEYASGETLEAVLQSRFIGAKVLLTLRDSTGVRWWKTVEMKGQEEKFSVQLPPEFKYACDLAAQYVEGDGRVHVADQVVRVRPEQRFITVKTDVKEQVSPGETVKLNLSVNRNEPVDLVVSVYDQSLLGIKADKQADIRNFYFADERALLTRDRDLVRRRLGHLMLGAAAEQAEKVIKEKEGNSDPREQQYVQQMRNVVSNVKNGYLNSFGLMLLLQAMDVPVQFRLYYSDGWQARFDKDKLGQMRLIDVMEANENNQWYLSLRYTGDTLVVMPMHPSYVNNPQYYGYSYYGRSRAYGYYDNEYEYAARPNGALRDEVKKSSARGDGSYSITGNASFSVEGQAAISHMGGGFVPMEIDAANTSDNPGGVRRDFSDAAFWNAHVRTDVNGKATVEFKLPDSLTNWQVVVTAVTKDLQVGSAKTKFRTFKPVMVWPMLPRNFTEGDQVAIFATVHNHTDKEQMIKTTLKIDNGELIGSPATVSVKVPAGGNRPVYWTYKAATTGYAQMLMSAECEGGSDASLKRLPVIDASVWEARSYAGFCKGDVSFALPEGIDPATAKMELSIAPSLAADMAETLDYLVDYPHGCVEQTMSRFLPALKVAQILQKYDIQNAPLKEKLPKCMDMGIKRLLELQQADGGWGWNGNGQTHEMFTPYALYGLLEAEKGGYKIPNETAVQRGLVRLRQFIDAMGEAQASDRIYCMYVYSNRMQIEDAWWSFIESQLNQKKLTDYATAMSLEMAAKTGKKALAEKLMASLRERGVRNGDGMYWTTAKFSRWGDDPNEITAAVLKGIVAWNAEDELIPQILTFFAQAKRGNKWNSTKDTAMILYAMCDYLASRDYNLKGAKTVALRVNDGKKQELKIENSLTQKLTFAADTLLPLNNSLHFENAAAGMMYRVVLRYRLAGKEIKAQANGINVTREFYELGADNKNRLLKSGDTVSRGAYIMSIVRGNTNLGGDLRYVLVESPKPGSCEIQPIEDRRFVNYQQATQYVLREDKEVGVFWHHEQTGGNIQDCAVFRCEMAGDFVVAPASIEMMYRTETRGHSDAFKFTVKSEDAVAAK